MSSRYTLQSTRALPNSPVKIPALGFGVYQSHGDTCLQSCLTALKAGYRHIDSAQYYANEDQVGEAVKKSGIPRKDIFITTKILTAGNNDEETYQSVIESIDKIDKGGYVDLYLIHSPNSGSEARKIMWTALEKAHKEGRAKAIGVSNFGIGHIEELKQYAHTWPPHVNQIELHPWSQQREAVAYCEKNKIVVEAYCPLVRNQKADDPTLNSIAKKHNKGTGQILIRYCLQKGWVPLPKSDTPSRIEGNADIFDFELSKDDMETLDDLDQATPSEAHTVLCVDATPPPDAGIPLNGFVSFSIEFAYFPDYAGNISDPNTFSNNLLQNIYSITGTKPYVRVGGNTQDYALYNASLPSATFGIINPARSTDYPTTLSIGPSFFESYSTWSNVRFIHGFNLAKNGSSARSSLLATVPIVCKALSHGDKLAYWELGNEPDLYKTSSQGPVRPPTWSEADYVREWLNGTRAIKQAMGAACPNLTTDAAYKFYAPSFGGTSNSLDPVRTWADGLDADADVATISSHNYIGGATQPGVTLQRTLLNHSSTVASIAKQLNESRLLAALRRPADPALPFVLGETNSLYNEGAPGLSNSFGAALWTVDFGLWCAASGIRRVHMHQGTDYRYAAWQPVDTALTPKGTKPPYYASVTVAAFLGDLGEEQTRPRIVSLPLDDEREAAYAAYVNETLQRVIVVNMNEYNSSNNYTDGLARPVDIYKIKLPQTCKGVGTLQRLMANGSDAVSGITFDGVSYNYELDNGMPVRLGNVTTDETADIREDGNMLVDVPWSSAVIVRLSCEEDCL
ncbi:hypothetical protein MBLNU459_g0351t1 [Dothideomycetes sp. NU459]